MFSIMTKSNCNACFCLLLWGFLQLHDNDTHYTSHPQGQPLTDERFVGWKSGGVLSMLSREQIEWNIHCPQQHPLINTAFTGVSPFPAHLFHKITSQVNYMCECQSHSPLQGSQTKTTWLPISIKRYLKIFQ